jgi:chemotaxis signal transduction protein
MLMLQFYINDKRLVLDTQHIVEVLPQVHLEPIPRSPDYLIGRMNYRGQPVSVVDLARLMDGETCIDTLQTRMILCQYDDAGEVTLLALLAERVINTLRVTAEDFVQEGLQHLSIDWLDGILPDPKGGIQAVHFPRLLKRVLSELRKGEEERV